MSAPWLAGLLGVLLFGLPALAEAQAEPEATSRAGETSDVRHDEEARALFEAATLAFDDGRFEDALDLYERSYALSQRPELLFNIGTTADRLRRDRRALRAFEGYLARVPEAPNRRSVERRVMVLRESVEAPSPAEVAQANSLNDNAQPDPIPAPAHVDLDGAAPTPTESTERSQSSKRALWLGLGVGGAVLVAVSVLIGVLVAGNGDADPRESADGVLIFALGSP